MAAILNGVRIAYDDTGRGAGLCLLLIHGFPLDGRMWRAQVSGLDAVARVIVPDLRGCGRSAVPPGPYTMEQHADDLVALLDHLGIKRAVVGGLSMGGYVALALWRRAAERVAGLVLMDTRAEADAPAAREARNSRIAAVRANGVGPFAEEQLGGLLAPASLANTELRRAALDLMRGQTSEGVIGALAGLRDRGDSTATLPTITAPTLVIVGAEDALTPPPVARDLAAAIPGAELVVIEAAGHLAPLENPGDVNRALAAFLARVGGGDVLTRC